MTWEEIIIKIRKDPSYRDLVRLAYFDEDLSLNVQRFRESEEFIETCRMISEYVPVKEGTKILDVGAGNGVASLAFALHGYKVTAVEPDPSETIGSGAIKKLKEYYSLPDLIVDESFGERLPFKDESFDIVYIRQAMHHAQELEKFVKESARVLKRGGLLVTVRDHVILDSKDKEWFLESHLLHKYYGGENAFTFGQYKSAICSAGLQVKKVLRHYDSVINYFPETKESVDGQREARNQLVRVNLRKKLPAFVANNSLVCRMYERRLNNKLGPAPDEKKIPGRMISFFATKP